MNRMIATLCILVLVVSFVTLHTIKIMKLDREVNDLCGRVDDAFTHEDWETIKSCMADLEKRWNQSRLWASLTIDTAKIEEIEISMRQCSRYAEIQAKEDFIGEFIMFQMLIDHLPHQEGFSVEELL